MPSLTPDLEDQIGRLDSSSGEASETDSSRVRDLDSDKEINLQKPVKVKERINTSLIRYFVARVGFHIGSKAISHVQCTNWKVLRKSNTPQ